MAGTAEEKTEAGGPRISRLGAHALLLRPQQWTKNLIVLAPLLFAAQLHYPAQVFRAILFFLSFCAVSSAVYIFNDIVDREADRAHPRKRRRPVASGMVGLPAAWTISAALLAGGLLVARDSHPPALACLAGYVLLQIAYTSYLKHLVILDLMAIAAGFVLRAVAGALAIEVSISPWLLICTILLALFLAMSKRRSELSSSNDPRMHRRVLGDYSLAFLDQLISIVTSCTVLAYILYTFSEQTMKKFPSHLMPLTSPFVLYGIFRYLYLVHQKSAGGEPELMLLKDLPLLVNIILWTATVVVIVALG